VKYAWIKNHMTEFPVDLMCRFMRVSRSAYYAWLHRTPATGEKDDAELTGIVQALFTKSRATSGARRLKIELGRRGRTVSRRRLLIRNIGANDESRTLDLLITNELLYQLSYIGSDVFLRYGLLFLSF
jgi:putative transposase